LLRVFKKPDDQKNKNNQSSISTPAIKNRGVLTPEEPVDFSAKLKDLNINFSGPDSSRKVSFGVE
jgi:hypothetical protein